MGTIGRSLRRVEDLSLLTGRAVFAGDVRVSGQLSAFIVRAQIAHAKLTDVDVSAARELPGVIAAWDAKAIESDFGSIPQIQPRVSFDESVVPFLQPVIAHERVRYVGEPIAIVVAEDRYVAEDAGDLVFADFDSLDAVVHPRSAVDEPSLFPEGNEVTVLRASFGEVEEIFRTAEVVIEHDFSTERHSGVPMETRGFVVEFDPLGETLIFHGATKVPHANRSQLADHLGISSGKIRMKETSVGGGFGVRGEYYPEDFLVAWAALKLRRSIGWIEDRREHLVAANQSREQHHRAAIAGDEEGRLLAIRSEFWADMGAYVRSHGVRVPDLTLSMLPGPYDFAAYEGIAHCVVTNRTPTATYRAPGRFESCFVRERLVDLYASKLRADPIEVRRKNLIRADQMPYSRQLVSTGEPVVYNEGDYRKLLDRVAEELDRESIASRRAGGERVGVGLAMFLEKSGLGPWESGSVSVTPEGEVLVRSGCSSVGQGLRTVLGQVVAEVLDVELERVRVELLDTDHTQFGTGSYASRSTATAGSAVFLSAQKVVEKAKVVAARRLEVHTGDLIVKNGGIEVMGTPTLRMGLNDIAAALDPIGAESYGLPPGLEAEDYFHVTKLTYPYGAHAAVVSVDPETGLPTVEKLILGYDVGRAVNPLLVEGQLHGGALQGLAGAILERFVFDEDGNPLVTSFMDYLMPTASEAPVMQAVVTEVAPTETNPLGVKGAGEGGLTGVAAAIAAAIDDALGWSGAVTSLPVDPALLMKRSLDD
jgi:carbon-monoxide dehydrogenase large subunit